jgi:peptidoglycan/LPS O-acetylase OafA/YrhL
MKVKHELLPLTSMRFFLAAWVVIYHQTFGEPLSPEFLGTLPTPVYDLLRTGYIAVGVFFVLSGFVLALNYSLAESWSKRSFLSFAIARLSRIYPVYVLGMLLVTPVILGPQLFPFSPFGVARKLFSGTLNLLMVQAWLPQAALTWNSPGWSLSDEAFFYACFPVLGLWLWRIRGIRKCLGMLAVLWAAELALPMAAVLLPFAGFGDLPAVAAPSITNLWAGIVKFNPLLQLPLFCSGILTARIFLLLKDSRLQNRGHWLYVPGILCGAVVIFSAHRIPYPLLHNGLLLPSYFAVILGFGLNGGILAKLLSHRVVVFLGKASYSQYILQYPARLLFVYLTRNRIAGVPGVTLQFMLLLLMSSLAYRFLEEPAHQFLRKIGRSWVDGSPSPPRQSVAVG